MVKEEKITLSNGVELTYEEHGRGNRETIIHTEFYFGTFRKWVGYMAEDFHVYALTMRLGGKATQVRKDGKTDWPEQWADDIYQFSRAIGADKFIHVGKCHGSVPGWCLVNKHPEALKAFVPVALLPFSRTPKPPNPILISWSKALADGSPEALREGLKTLICKPENIEEKVQEILESDLKEFMKEGGIDLISFLPHLKTDKELADWYSKIKIPVLCIYPTDDPGFDDEMVMLAAKTIPGMKLVTFQGLRHFSEMDYPERYADEVKSFITQINR